MPPPRWLNTVDAPFGSCGAEVMIVSIEVALEALCSLVGVLSDVSSCVVGPVAVVVSSLDVSM